MHRAARLAVVATHPIQYYSPLYRRLGEQAEIDLTVFYAHIPTPADQGHGFGVAFCWDVDLLGGYRSTVLHNVAREPSAATFAGCDTPGIGPALRNGRFDAVLVLGWHSKTYIQALNAARRLHVPTLVRGDSQLMAESWLKRVMKRFVYPSLLRRFAVCLAVGKRSAEYFEYYGARHIVRAPHFVDNGFFGNASVNALSRRAELRRAWGLPESAPIFLFAGKLTAKKRPTDLLHAIAATGVPSAVAVFVGDGVLRHSVQATAVNLGVTALFLGFLNQSEIPRAYAIADVLVLPSDGRETWGLVVNEAMASGRPAIVSQACGCTPDLIIEGVTGFSYPCGDARALAALVRRFTLGDGLADHLGGQAKRHVAAFSVDAAAAGVAEGVRTAFWSGS